MWTERLATGAERAEAAPGGFVAVPMLFVGFADPASLQRQLYAVAYAQARQAMLDRQRLSPRDLFAIMN